MTPSTPVETKSLQRRDFLKWSAGASILTAGILPAYAASPANSKSAKHLSDRQAFAPYEGPNLDHVAFPMGGIGAGMICLEGTGALSHVSLRHRPDLFNEPCIFAALSVTAPHKIARVLEGPAPSWKIFGLPKAAEGFGGKTYGLPRFREVSFQSRFPFGNINLSDPDMPVSAKLTGWSPFTPGDADASSLPVAALEYHFSNTSGKTVEAVFSFNSGNFMPVERSDASAIQPLENGYILWAGGHPDRPWDEGSFAVAADAPGVKVNHAWFRGHHFDAITMAWKDVENAAYYDRPPVKDEPPVQGASLFVPLRLRAGETRTLRIRLCWYVNSSNLRASRQGDPDFQKEENDCSPTYKAWYTARFKNIHEVEKYWKNNYNDLHERSFHFANTLFASTLPAEVMEAVEANLSILKSPTVLRQHDGRFWAWEASGDSRGLGPGTCTHVWNYAQAVPHLFPDLERSLRETEFGANQNAQGNQQFRAVLPIRPIDNAYHPAADGQLGGILKIYRDWHISGDTTWLRKWWPKVRQSLDFCIETWDPDHLGWLEEPHHNTYDIEFWGPDGMCTSIYLGALKAAVEMGKHLNDPVDHYSQLFDRGCERMQQELFNGEYYIQKVRWEGSRAGDPLAAGHLEKGNTVEGRELVRKSGPKYQYGTGCLSDGIIGAWFAHVCGLGSIFNENQVAQHLQSVYHYNLKHDLSDHANPQRPVYAWDKEGGLLLCTWPHGDMPPLPFIYSNEVWTGIEYQVASHMIFMGMVDQGLDIVRTCRARYDGRVRNPYSEVEWGRWYARALASYSLLQAFSGARYDAVEQVLHLQPRIAGDFSCFLATASGYGLVGLRSGKPFLDVKSGSIPLRDIRYTSHN